MFEYYGRRFSVILLAGCFICMGIILAVGCYVPEEAKVRWGWKEGGDTLKAETYQIEFGDNTYLKSWARKYKDSTYKDSGGVRSTRGTYDRIRYEMVKMLAGYHGKNSPVWKKFQELKTIDVLQDSLKAEMIFDEVFSGLATKFGYGSYLADKLYDLAVKIKNDRRIYNNPFDEYMMRNQLFSLTMKFLSYPFMEEIEDSLLTAEFPGRQEVYLFKEDGMRNYVIQRNFMLDLIKNGSDDDKLLAIQLPEEAPDNWEETGRQFIQWEKKINVGDEDLLPVKELHIMIPYNEPDTLDYANKVGVDFIWYFRLKDINIESDSFPVAFEYLVNKQGIDDTLLYKNIDTVYNVNDIKSKQLLKVLLFADSIHTIVNDSLDNSGMSRYKVSGKISVNGQSSVKASFLSIPKSKNTLPVWEMYRLLGENYSIDQFVTRGDTITFQIPISGSILIPNKQNKKLFSNAVYLFWEPEHVPKKHKPAVTIKDVQVIEWESDSTIERIADTLYPKDLYRYEDIKSSLFMQVFYSPKPVYQAKVTFVVPDDVITGNGTFKAMVFSHDYRENKTKPIAEAVWRGSVR